MNTATDSRISPETLQRLREPYRTVAAATGFAALSRFEQWERLRDRAAQTSIDRSQLETLDAVDITLKSQLLDWLQQSVSADSRAR